MLEPAPENWISFRNGYKLWGYSSLTQIDRGNVGELRLVWSRAMEAGWQEVEPLVYNGVMFLANVRDILQALDAATGDLLWEYRRALPDNPASFTGTLYRYRNVAIYDDKIFLATNDAFLVALDAQTGELVWETQRADFREQVAQTAGPIVVNGLVITGSRCNPQSPRPGGCFITGHDADTGEEVWRDQHRGDTGPARWRHVGWAAAPRPGGMHRHGWSAATTRSSTSCTGALAPRRPCRRSFVVRAKPTSCIPTRPWRSTPRRAR